jgi:eukaryotic-like serine/threonine-protein kinase
MLAGRYRLEEHIASGGMAAVWRAHDEVLARTVAVKLLHDHLSADEAFRERFRREAISAAKLTHPHVVGLYDTGSDDERVWLVMEFVAGQTLRDLLDEEGSLPPERACAIGERVARALAYAHRRGLVHRDVKPANILIGTDGQVKVADFGIAKAEESGDDLTRTGMVLGTAAYVAPEQLRAHPLDGRADQYGLACVLYEALAGQPPFSGPSAMAAAAQRLEHDPPSLRDIDEDLPAALDTAIARALARSPDDRYPSAEEFADALTAFARDDTEQLAIAVASPSTTAETSRPHRRRRWPVPLVAAVVAVGAVVALAGGLDLSDLVQVGGDSTPTEAAEGAISPTGVTLFDPEGGTSEQRRSDELPLIIDGDASTSWSTVGYDTPDFAGLKSGVGFWVDLGEAHELDRVALRTTTPGITVDVRVADEPASTPEQWELMGSEDGISEQVDFDPDEPVRGRYVLVWVTGDLQPDGDGRFRAGFSDMAIRGSPA